MYQYCSRCGTEYDQISLNIFLQSPQKIKCKECNLTIYNNPRLAVGAVIMSQQNQYLMTKRGIEPHKGLYDFPGGFANYGETAEQAIERELEEELGLQPSQYTITSILGTFHHLYENLGRKDELYSVTIVMFFITTTESTFTAQDDVANCIWIDCGDKHNMIAYPELSDFIEKHNRFR